MLPIRIAGATRNLGAPADWDPDTSGPCLHLPIRDEVVEGLPYMTSRWEPTPDELAALIAGRPVELRIIGTTHPVVSLIVAGD
ncbi:hypothetical protein [uncultured Brevundimonas sp.]|uniref:hypothetical protein n=1 Tax=uncultured Brevundimonas sp. TaxID=213418 RepID=UPI0026286503|nr:hypothetical protein [uncultured Brevundimonas sp.]